MCNLEIARKIYRDTLSSMDLIGNAAAKPNQNLTTRINNYILEKKKAAFKAMMEHLAEEHVEDELPRHGPDRS